MLYAPSGPSGTFDLSDGLNDPSIGGGGFIASLRTEIEGFRKGVSDAARLERSFNLVWSDHELRTLVIKSTVINLLSLLLLSLGPAVLSPLFSRGSSTPISPTIKDRTREISMWYNLLLSWPVFVVCFWINSSWSPDISRRAHTLLHPAYRHQPSPTPSSPGHGTSSLPSSHSLVANPSAWIWHGLTRMTLTSDFVLVTRLIALVPFLGRPSAFIYMCIIDSYHFFESTFLTRGWGLDHRITFMQDRIGYMAGFGLIATSITSLGSPLVNLAIFALVYPFFVIQALQSRPPVPRKQSLGFPSTPSPMSSLPPSPGGEGTGLGLTLQSPFFVEASTHKPRRTLAGLEGKVKVPIFFLARYALQGLAWLELALGRDRTRSFGLERPGKRAM